MRALARLMGKPLVIAAIQRNLSLAGKQGPANEECNVRDEQQLDNLNGETTMPLDVAEKAIVANIRKNEELTKEMATEVDVAISKVVRSVLKRHGILTTPPQATAVATALGFLPKTFVVRPDAFGNSRPRRTR